MKEVEALKEVGAVAEQELVRLGAVDSQLSLLGNVKEILAHNLLHNHLHNRLVNAKEIIVLNRLPVQEEEPLVHSHLPLHYVQGQIAPNRSPLAMAVAKSLLVTKGLVRLLTNAIVVMIICTSVHVCVEMRQVVAVVVQVDKALAQEAESVLAKEVMQPGSVLEPVLEVHKQADTGMHLAKVQALVLESVKVDKEA